MKYFKAFDELRASVLTAFRTYLEDATQVIRVMKTYLLRPLLCERRAYSDHVIIFPKSYIRTYAKNGLS